MSVDPSIEDVPGTDLKAIPDMKEMKGSGLFCFLSPDRACGPSCMAYLTSPPTGDKEFRDQQWPHCHLLVNVHRMGKHLVVLASGLDAIKRQGPPPPVAR